MFKYKCAYRHLFICAFCLIITPAYASNDHSIQARFSHLDSHALWLLKSPMQTHFKETQKYKLRTFLNIGMLHNESEGDTEFEIKNARLRVGQDFVPYELDSYTPSSLLRWSNYSNWASQVSARTRLHRDTGIQIYGQLSDFNYGVALLQGSGISRRDTGSGPAEFRLSSDNNYKKDLAARLIWHTPFQDLTTGMSIYRGKQGDDDPASYLSAGGITDEQHTGFHAEYTTYKWYMSFEFNHSSIYNMIVPRSDGVLIRSGRAKLNDTTLSLRYSLNRLLEPKFRFKRFNSSSDIDDLGDADRIMGFAALHNSYVFGVNFNIKATRKTVA